MEGGREEDIHTIGISNSLDRLLYFKSALSLEWFQDTPTFIILLISHYVLPVLSGVLRDRENITELMYIVENDYQNLKSVLHKERKSVLHKGIAYRLCLLAGFFSSVDRASAYMYIAESHGFESRRSPLFLPLSFHQMTWQ